MESSVRGAFPVSDSLINVTKRPNVQYALRSRFHSPRRVRRLKNGSRSSKTTNLYEYDNLASRKLNVIFKRTETYLLTPRLERLLLNLAAPFSCKRALIRLFTAQYGSFLRGPGVAASTDTNAAIASSTDNNKTSVPAEVISRHSQVKNSV